MINPNSQVFYDFSKEFWHQNLTDNFEKILVELNNVLLRKEPNHWISAYKNYVTTESKSAAAWKTFDLLFFGIKNRNNTILCPITTQLIEQIPGIVTAQFSVLSEKTKINSHKGYSKLVIRNHLPLIVPKGDLGIIIKGEKAIWETNKILSFNDWFEHEAYNNSEEIRVVLMFDIANPYLNYTAKEICDHRMLNVKDQSLISMASKEQWKKWYLQGYFS